MSFSAQADDFYALECEGDNLTTDGNPFYVKFYATFRAKLYIPDGYYERFYRRKAHGSVVDWYKTPYPETEVEGLNDTWTLNKKTAQITLGVNGVAQTHDCKKMDIKEKAFDKFIKDQKLIKTKDNILPELD